jgi:hypothetical protein
MASRGCVRGSAVFVAVLTARGLFIGSIPERTPEGKVYNTAMVYNPKGVRRLSRVLGSRCDIPQVTS